VTGLATCCFSSVAVGWEPLHLPPAVEQVSRSGCDGRAIVGDRARVAEQADAAVSKTVPRRARRGTRVQFDSEAGLPSNNILASVLRQAHDTGKLRNIVVTNPRRATGVGHITNDEMLRQISEMDAANGFGNRFLCFCVRRSKLPPDGGGLPDFGDIVAGSGQRGVR